MTSVDVDLPSEWRVQRPTAESGAPTTFRYRTSTGTRFIVAVARDPTDETSYTLHLSTETPTNVRHDYPVDSFDSREAALSAAESFMPYLTARVRQDKLSASDPSIDAVQESISSFRDDSLLESLRRAVGQLR